MLTNIFPQPQRLREAAAAGAEGSWVNGVLFSTIRIRALSSHQASRSFLAGNRAGPAAPSPPRDTAAAPPPGPGPPSRGSRGQDAPNQSLPPPRTRKPAAESPRPRSARESEAAGRRRPVAYPPWQPPARAEDERRRAAPFIACTAARTSQSVPPEQRPPAVPCRAAPRARRWAPLRGWRVGAWVCHAEQRQRRDPCPAPRPPHRASSRGRAVSNPPGAGHATDTRGSPFSRRISRPEMRSHHVAWAPDYFSAHRRALFLIRDCSQQGSLSDRLGSVASGQKPGTDTWREGQREEEFMLKEMAKYRCPISFRRIMSIHERRSVYTCS
nr:uncharacterized protein LOC129478261 [Symphalangus syndactylus]